LFTVGSLGIDSTENVGFDISESKSGKGLASVILNGEASAKLYSVDLSGGHATLIGSIAASSPVIDIAIQRAGAVRLDQATYSVNENATTLSVVVERVGASSNSFSSGASVPATVVINTNGFSASAGLDFASLNNTVVSFADGEVSKTVQVSILDDGLDEEAEIFTVFLSSPTGGLILGDSGAAAVYILDNDPAGGTADTTAPVLSLDVNKKIDKSRFLSQGLKFKAGCDENCTIEATLTVSRGIANRFKLSSQTLVSLSKSLDKDNKKQLTLRPSAEIRRKLLNKSGSIPVTLSIVAKDAAGNSDMESAKIVIKDDIRRR
jgi:hypothetical protein